MGYRPMPAGGATNDYNQKSLIAVAAIAILTSPCISMANESALYPPSGGVIRLHNDPGGLITAYRDRFTGHETTENVSSLTEYVSRPVPWLSASCRMADYA